MQALLWGIPNTHVNALCLHAAFTTSAFVVQVSAARQAGLVYGRMLSDTPVAQDCQMG